MEIWKDIPSWEGWYQVSDQGRVRSLDRYSTANSAPAHYSGKILAANPTKTGYPMVTLSRPGVRSYKTVHNLVMLVFKGPPPKGLEVCHNDGIRTDCALGNLRYDTRRNNALDRNAHGTMLRETYPNGEQVHNSLLNDESVKFIRSHPEKTLKELGQMFGVHLGTIHNVRKYKTWKHLP